MMRLTTIPLKTFGPLVAVLGALVFIFDYFMPRGVAGGLPYVALILFSLWAPGTRIIFILAVSTSALTVLDTVIAPDGAVTWIVVMNRVLTLLVIWVTAALGLMYKREATAVGQARDHMQDALKKSEERLRAILDNTSAVIYLKDLEGKYLLINRRFEELFHLQRDEIAGKTDHHLFPKEMADAFRANDLKALNAGTPIEMEEVAPLDDGLHTYISTKFPIKDEHGRINAVAGISTDITALRKEDMELRRVKESLAKAQAVARLGNWELDLVTNEGWWSDETFRLVGMEPGGRVPSFKEFLGRVHPDDRGLMIEAMNAALRGETHYELDFRVALPDMSRRILHVQAEILRDETGKPVKMLGVTQDVTRRRGAEEELRNSRERLNRIVETVTEGIYIVNADGRIEFANAAAEKIFGLPRNELYQRAFNDPGWTLIGVDGRAFGADDYPFSRVRKALQPVRNIEFAVSRTDGARVVVSINAAPLFDQSGAFAGMVATQRDITEEKRAEGALKESERKYRALIDGASDAIIMTDDRGNIREANRKAEALFGRRKEKLIGMDYQTLMSPESLAEATGAFTDLLLRGGSIYLQDAAILAPGGGRVPVEITGSLIEHSGGRFVQGIFRDTTDRKKAEDALKRAHRENEQLIASLPSILIWTDGEDNVVRWNTEAAAVFGLKPGEAIGVQFSNLRILWDWADVTGHISECRDSRSVVRADEIRYVRASGKEGFLGATFCPVFGDGGEWKGFLFIGADVTERKILGGQLAQAQKLESIGQLAAGIAHEINTPIQYVGDNLRFLKDSFSDLIKLLSECSRLTDVVKSSGAHGDLIGEISEMEKEVDVEYLCEEIPKAVTQSLGGVERVAKIVRAMKEFSHPGVEERTPIDINRAIESTIMVCKNEWKYVSDMVTDFDPDLPFVPCVPGEFNQVILNLIVNSAHAIADVVGDGSKGKGKITVTTRRAGEFADIRVTDTGGGIPDKIRDKIFDPFFTTKPVGKGTGQGLAIAHNVIVDKHKGFISLETEPGKGTTFIVRLPLDSASGS